jgi:hypothetical protein
VCTCNIIISFVITQVENYVKFGKSGLKGDISGLRQRQDDIAHSINQKSILATVHANIDRRGLHM